MSNDKKKVNEQNEMVLCGYVHEGCKAIRYFYLETGNWTAVETPGILSRVFLFHFEKISGYFGLFRVFRDISVNTNRNSRFGLKIKKKKKKKILKPKQICILYTEKPQKKKKMKRK